MKWRVMERTMAEMSQMLVHGGIAINDWFSDKLWDTSINLCSNYWLVDQFRPVESVKHFDGDQHWQSHCHRMRVVENITIDASEVFCVTDALEMVWQMIVCEMRSVGGHHEPPSSGTDRCRTDIGYYRGSRLAFIRNFHENSYFRQPYI